MSVQSPEDEVEPVASDLPAAADQAAQAAARVRERTAERRANIQEVGQGRLGHADTLERVALRVDRLSRQIAREDVPRVPGEEPTAPPEDVIAAAVDRAAPLLGVADEARAAASPADAAGIVLEAVIGAANFLEVRYLGVGAKAARAIGRVVLRDAAGRVVGYGTGSMVSPRLLLTNHHVLESAEVARRATIEFGYEDGLDDRPLRPVSFPLDPDAFFLNDQGLDFALVAARAGAAQLAPFGFNRLLSVGGRWSNGDFLSIVQHPGGRPKEVALRENRLVDSVGAFVHYQTDTEPGSSGSPVFNDGWEVVALHHASVRAQHPEQFGPVINEGIRIGLIIAFAREHVAPTQQPLLAGLVLAETVSVVEAPSGGDAPPSAEPPAVPAATKPPADEPLEEPSPAAAPPATTARLTIPLEITLSIGAPFGTGSAVASVGGAPSVAGTAGEAITIDPNYADRRGYDTDFLGTGTRRVPLPALSPAMLAEAARMKGVTGANAHVIPYHHFSVVQSRERRLPFFTAVNIDGRRSVRIKRESDRWSLDPRLDASAQTGEAVYKNNPLDRGHLVRRLDPAWGATTVEAKRANDDTFHFTNCTPQHEDFNQNSSTWAGLEDYLLDNADNLNFRATVFTGPVLAPDDDLYRGVKLPRQFWKVAVMVRGDGRLSATAYLLSQASLIEGLESLEEFSYGAYRTFQVRVDRIESLTGLSFGALAAADPLHGLESTGPAVYEIARSHQILL